MHEIDEGISSNYFLRGIGTVGYDKLFYFLLRDISIVSYIGIFRKAS